MTDLWGSLLRRGMRLGFDRGLLGGSPLWLVLGALALLGHLAGRAMERDVGGGLPRRPRYRATSSRSAEVKR